MTDKKTEAVRVEEFSEILKILLDHHNYKVESYENLLYELYLDNKLECAIDPARLKKPTRGDSAFQTDLCVYVKTPQGLWIPKVVFEFKVEHITTHDVITYSNKANRHKNIYPYLRYGLVVYGIDKIPGRFFKHNEGMDFCLIINGKPNEELVSQLVQKELKASDTLEEILFSEKHERWTLFRSEIELQ